MKRLIFLLVGALLVSCTNDNVTEVVDETQFTIKTAATDSNFGTYYGTFTSVDDSYTGTVEIHAKPSGEGEAIVFLNSDKAIELDAFNDSFTHDGYSELLFVNDQITFVFSVDGNGINPLVQNCIINGIITNMLIKE